MNKKNKIYNPWNGDYAPSLPERGGGDILVETAGFIDKETQLAILLQSGEALDRYYKKMFPGQNSDDEPTFDPTAQKGYDYFDAFRDSKYARGRLYEQKRAENAKKREPVSAPEPAPVDNPELAKV
jgi:hypothetical protein